MDVRREARIYEYEDKYFVLELSQQGVARLDTPHQRPSEIRALGKVLPCRCMPEELGAAAVAALERFDIEPAPFEPWDMVAHRKTLKSLIGYKSLPSFERNNRLVLLELEPSGALVAYPSDNHRTNPWQGLIAEQTQTLKSWNCGAEVGALVLRAFELSTWHPERGV